MENLPTNGHTKAGTAGGTLLIFLLQIGSGEVIKTAVLAAVGALVSFSMSVGLRWLLRQAGKK